MDIIQEKIALAPKLPGCYKFYNSRRDIIYIGKSKSLQNRLKQHFAPLSGKYGKYVNLYREVKDIDYVLTDNESEALLLECRLIKEHLPKYNAMLTRKKSYPYLKIGFKNDFPTISVSDTADDDRSKYFGCFYNADDAYETIVMFNKIWHTPLCGKEKFTPGHRPCLNYHIKRCQAPCCALADKDSYNGSIGDIIKCLNGSGYKALFTKTAKNMKRCAGLMDYEGAAFYRDALKTLSYLERKVKKLNTALADKDVFLFFSAYGECAFNLYFIHNGDIRVKLRFASKTGPDTGLLERMVIKAKGMEAGGPFEESPEHLLEISADKLFVPVNLSKNEHTLYKTLVKELKYYIGKK